MAEFAETVSSQPSGLSVPHVTVFEVAADRCHDAISPPCRYLPGHARPIIILF